MWFAFGLVTLVAAGAATAWRRRASDWEGTRVGHYMHLIRRNKARIESVRIGVETRSTLEFECKPEGDLDRFFKRRGLTREYQSGQQAFDDTLYMVSDDPRVAAALRADPTLAENLLALHDAGYGGFAFKRVTCRGGRVWVDFSNTARLERADDLLTDCVPPLEALAAALPAGAAGKGGDRLLPRSVVVLALSSGLAINGALQLSRVYLGGALLLLLCLLTLKLLFRTSRFHLVLAEVLLMGAFGSFATAYAGLRDFNMEFDHGARQVLEATVVDTRIVHRTSRRGRRHSYSYYVTLADWNGAGPPVERPVSKHLYYNAGKTITIGQHPGRLGLRWAEGLDDSN